MSRTGWLARPLLFFVVAAAAPRGAAEDSLRLLPGKPEVKLSGSRLGELLIDARGKDVSAFDLLMTISAIEQIHVIVDDRAADELRSAVVTVDLRNRALADVVDLVGAAAGVDVERDANTYQLLGAPLDEGPVVRAGLRRAAQRMYEQALIQPGDAKLAATALRGMAELHRLSGDLFTAYSLYETLLSDPYQTTPAAKDCELLLADCYVGIGNLQRASKLLRNFVDQSANPRASERALRRLVTVLADLGRFQAVENLRGPFTMLGTLQEETQKKIAEAAATMMKRGAERSAALVLRDIWSVDPVRHAMLGPVLSLALVMNGDAKSADEVLRAALPHMNAAKDASAAMWAFAEIAAATHRDAETVVFGNHAMHCSDAGPEVRRRCHLLLADMYEGIGLPERARGHYYEAELLSTPEDAVDLAMRSAYMTLAAGEPEHARLMFQAAGEYQFRREETDYGVAKSLLAADEPARALAQVRSLLRRELDEKLRERVRLLAVDCLQASGRVDDALRLLGGDVEVLTEEGSPMIIPVLLALVAQSGVDVPASPTKEAKPPASTEPNAVPDDTSASPASTPAAGARRSDRAGRRGRPDDRATPFGGSVGGRRSRRGARHGARGRGAAAHRRRHGRPRTRRAGEAPGGRDGRPGSRVARSQRESRHRDPRTQRRRHAAPRQARPPADAGAERGSPERRAQDDRGRRPRRPRAGRRTRRQTRSPSPPSRRRWATRSAIPTARPDSCSPAATTNDW